MSITNFQNGSKIGFRFKGEKNEIGEIYFFEGQFRVTAPVKFEKQIISDKLDLNKKFSGQLNDMVLDASGIDLFKLTLTTNCKIDQIKNLEEGSSIGLIVTQGISGGNTLTLPSTIKTESGSSYIASETPGSVDFLTFKNLDGEILLSTDKGYSTVGISSVPVMSYGEIGNVADNKIVLTMSENLATVVPATSAFTVVKNGSPYTNFTISITSNKITLTLGDNAKETDTYTISYTKPTQDPIQDLDGDTLASFSSRTVANNVLDLVAPILNSAEIGNVSNDIIRMTFSETLLSTSVPDSSSFVVTKNGNTNVAINSATLNSNVVDLNVGLIETGDVVTVSYIKGSPSIKDTSITGNEALSFTDHPVTNNIISYNPTNEWLRPLSENSEFWIAGNSEVGDDVGICPVYPEYKYIGTAPTYYILGGTGNSYFMIDSATGNIFVSQSSGLQYQDYTLNIQISKTGYVDTTITITIHVIDPARIIFIDPNAMNNGSGTKADPWNAWPQYGGTSGTVGNEQFYMQKRGTVYSGLVAWSDKEYIIAAAYGSGTKPTITYPNATRIFNWSGMHNCKVTNLNFSAPAAVPSHVYYVGGGAAGSGTTTSHMYTMHCTMSGGEYPVRIMGNDQDNIRFYFCEMRYGIDDNIYSQRNGSYATNLIFNGCYSHHSNQDWEPGIGQSIASGDALQLHMTDSYVIKNCLIDRSDTQYKFGIITNEIGTSGVIENNYIITPMEVGDDNTQSSAIYCGGVADLTIRNNKIFGVANGIQLRDADPIYTHADIYNNVINTSLGKCDFTGVTEVNWYNNVFLNGHMFIWGGGADSGIMYNNIFYNVTENMQDYGQSTYDYNMYFPTQFSRDTGTNSFVGNPQFIDIYNNDYRLQNTSDAIDQGVAIVGYTTDYEGRTIVNPPNCGISEFSGAASLTPPVVTSAGTSTDGTYIALAFNKAMSDPTGEESAFSLTSGKTISSISLDPGDSTIYRLYVNTAYLYNDADDAISYTPGTVTSQDTTALEAFSGTTVTNNTVQVVSPVFQSAEVGTISSAIIDVDFDIDLANVVPATTSIDLQKNGSSYTNFTLSISSGNLRVTMTDAALTSDIFTIAYTKPASNPLQSSSGGEVDSFTAQSVTNNVTSNASSLVTDDFESYSVSTWNSIGNQSANYTDVLGSQFIVDISGNQCMRSGYGSAYNYGRYSAVIPDADQYAQITLTRADANSAIGIALRVKTDGTRGGYGITINSTGIVVFKDTGSIVILQQYAMTWNVGDVLRAEISGNTLTVMRNGTPISGLGSSGTFNVTDFATGQFGLAGWGDNATSCTGDTFEGGNLNTQTAWIMSEPYDVTEPFVT